MSPTRRAVLTGLAAGVSGCTALPGNRINSPAGVQSPSRTRDGKTPSENNCTAGYDVFLAPFAPTTDLPITLDREAERELVAAAVDEGSTTYETYAQAPLNVGGVVERDGSYYRLSVTQTGRKEIEAYLFDLSWEKGRTASSGATVYDYEQLPRIDREALERLVSPEGEERRPTQGLTVRESPVPYPNGGDSSRLLPEDTAWVRWNDREYRISTGEQTTTNLRTFECGVNQIADDAPGLREWAATEYLVALSELSDAQRRLLEQASDDGDSYQECTPASDALAGIRSQLPDDRRLPQPAEGWYIADGERKFRLEISRWVY